MNDFGLSGSSKHTSDLYIDMEEESDEDDDSRLDYLCPFCLDGFDLVGFCCHVDGDHPVDVKSGICPVCAKRVGHMAVHIISQHGSFLKALCKKKTWGAGSHSTLSLLRKDSEDDHLGSFDEESSSTVSSSNMTADPLLSSFIYNSAPTEEPDFQQSSFTTERKLAEKSSDDSLLESRTIPPSLLPSKDQVEKARRCEFVQGLLYSAFLGDDL